MAFNTDRFLEKIGKSPFVVVSMTTREIVIAKTIKGVLTSTVIKKVGNGMFKPFFPRKPSHSKVSCFAPYIEDGWTYARGFQTSVKPFTRILKISGIWAYVSPRDRKEFVTLNKNNSRMDVDHKREELRVVIGERPIWNRT